MSPGPDRRLVTAPIAAMRKAPEQTAGQVTQALLGELVEIEETAAGTGFAKARLVEDGYAGYLPLAALGQPGMAATHRVIVPKTFRFAGPDVKAAALAPLYLNCRLAIGGGREGNGRFARVEVGDGGGFVLSSMIAPLAERAADPVGVAEGFVGVPYLWGGKSFDGLDCSGLVQLALQAAGVSCPRDSHMIEAAVGRGLDRVARTMLERGDLVFWKGHVGMMLDPFRLIHANGHHMKVVIEPVAEAIERIAANHGEVTSVRRLAF